MRYRFLLPALLLYFVKPAFGQDIHFTQFYNTPQVISPGLTGIFDGDQRFIGAYRGQWYEANAPYSTFFGMFDQKIYSPKVKKGFFGVGGMLGNDRAGDGNLSLLQLQLNGSYTYPIDKENLLTGGLMLGVGQRSFEFSKLRWNNQYNGDLFDPNLDPGEDFDDNGFLYGDVGVGLNYRAQKLGRRSSIDVGLSYMHFNKPKQTFANQQGSSVLQPRTSIYLIQQLQIADKIDVYWNGLAQLQDKYFEGIAGFGGRYHLNQKRGKELAVQAGVAYRFNAIGDAAITNFEVHYQYWRLGLSYDINVSDFRAATNRNGGPEVTIRYVIHKVKPIPLFRVCPII
ncbi:MAG: PorP/SprF family type IX secretion system membrane protein [Saprospiraceae bacterium]|nr:PorP/SprF family type IX secretion system membrane protein [Saprospiraceae bacterium]